jgi:hypothetical protein
MPFLKQSFKTYALLRFYLKNLSETSKSYFSPKISLLTGPSDVLFLPKMGGFTTT